MSLFDSSLPAVAPQSSSHLSQWHCLSLSVCASPPHNLCILPTFLLAFSSSPSLRGRLEAALLDHITQEREKLFSGAPRSVSTVTATTAVSNHSYRMRKSTNRLPVCNFRTLSIYLSFQLIGTFPSSPSHVPFLCLPLSFCRALTVIFFFFPTSSPPIL